MLHFKVDIKAQPSDRHACESANYRVPPGVNGKAAPVLWRCGTLPRTAPPTHRVPCSRRCHRGRSGVAWWRKRSAPPRGQGNARLFQRRRKQLALGTAAPAVGHRDPGLALGPRLARWAGTARPRYARPHPHIACGGLVSSAGSVGRSTATRDRGDAWHARRGLPRRRAPPM